MNLVFTICSNNYLAQALTLKESLHLSNPDVDFYIGLVDEPLPDIQKDKFNILPVKEIVDLESFNHMAGIYNITELNTAVKPYYFEYFFNKLQATTAVYLDPDIIVFHRFDNLFDLLGQYSVVVTPHYCSPPADTKEPSDRSILMTGVYNLGFIAFAKTNESLFFINWWKEKLLNHGYATNGLFTDQLWVNFLTCFCSKAFILRDPGYNMANWNLHERQISKKGNEYFVNNSFPLVFFHYSNYKLELPNRLASYNNRFLLPDRPDIRPLFEYYNEKLMANRIEYFKNITPKFGIIPRTKSNNYFKKIVIRILNKIIAILS
jgi:lipopolysaccharide biosynthesis glycosyltransferase